MTRKQLLSATHLRELLSYEPETGHFTRLTNVGGSKVGDGAGTRNSSGYLVTSIDGRLYYCHRLAVLWMTGEWPPQQVDHENGVRSDNRWLNLRKCTGDQNQQNLAMKSHNTSGATGVYFCKQTSKWRAEIRSHKRVFKLGRFDTIADAAAAYADAKAKVHEFQPVAHARRLSRKCTADEATRFDEGEANG